jgi:hypothetical protein
MEMSRATPAAAGGREAPSAAFYSSPKFSFYSSPKFSKESFGIDATPEQLEAATYNDPIPSPAWMRPWFICACGFECAVMTGEPFKFHRIPHRCIR